MIRFGIIGAGRIAHKFATDINAAEHATLVAVASRSLAKAKLFQEEFSLEYAFGSYEELVQHPDIDAIYVATPHNFHEEHAILALNNLKHVLCEKPIAVNQTQLNHMIQIATKNNVVLMEAMWTRFLPVYRYLEQLLQQKPYGDILQLDIRFGYSLIEDNNPKGRLLNPELAGGSLLDIGVYPISVFRTIIQDEILQMHTQAEFSETRVDTYLKMDMVLDNKQQTTVHLESAIDRLLSNTVVITFEHGTIEIPHFHQATSIIVNEQTTDYPHKSTGFEYQIDHFAQTVESGLKEDSIMPHTFSLAVSRLMDDIRKEIGLKYPFE